MRRLVALAFIAAVGVGCGDNIHPLEDAGPGSDAGCTTECTAGQTTCAADGTLVTCVVDATGCGTFPSGGGSACDAHQTCSAGANACACASDPTCSAGVGTYCTTDVVDNDMPATYTCATDADGCIYALPAFDDCGVHQSCTGAAGTGTCTCNLDATCDAGAGTYCTTDTTNGDAPATYTCATDAQSCVFSDPASLADCGTHQSCTGVDAAGTCTCNTDVNCPSGAGSFCDAGAGSFTTCTTDAQTCVFDAGATTCTAPTSCSDGGPGDAMCVCPVAAPTAGGGCGSEGEQICSVDGDVLTCGAVGTCDIWVDTVGCAGAGLACAGSGSTAACECPSPATGVFVADPNAAAITIGGVTLAPDGAASPSGCRYPVLGDAIAAATLYATLNTAPATAEIESASAGTFSTAETWPLVIPDRVTVTSDDTAVPATRYTLAPTADVGAAVIEGSGALDAVAITVAITTTTTPPAAVTFDDCTANAATGVDALAITFAAGATGAGIDVSEPTGGKACAPLVHRTTITGAFDGIVVSTASAAAPTSAAATIDDCTITGSLDDGVLVYQTAGTGVAIDDGTTISASKAIGVDLDTASAAAHTGKIAITGSLGTTTIANTSSGAIGIDVRNNATGQVAGGAVLDLTDVTVDGAPTAPTSGDSVNLTNATGVFAGTIFENNGNRGLFVSGGSVTMEDDTSSHHCFVEGSAVGNSGIRLDAGATLDATSLVAQNNTSWGINITSSTAFLTSCTLDNNTSGGVQAAGTDAADTATLQINSGFYSKNTGSGIVVGDFVSAQVFGAIEVEQNGGSGLAVDGANSTVKYSTPGGTSPQFSSNTQSGITLTAGTLTVAGTASKFVDVQDNAQNGISVQGGTFGGKFITASDNGASGLFAAPSTGTVTLTSSNVRTNTGDGILIQSTNATEDAVDIEDCSIGSNLGAFGIEIDSSPLPATGASTLIDGSAILGNVIGIGIGAGSSQVVAVAATDLTIENQTGAGIIYNSATTGNYVDLENVYVEGNGATAIGSQTVGGIGFEGTPPGTLTFANNEIGNDGGNEVDVYATAGTVTYNLGGGGNLLVECSTTSGFVALFAEAAGAALALVVDADTTQWASTTFPGTNTGTAGLAVITTLGASGGASCPGP
jgi:hypothetical protein